MSIKDQIKKGGKLTITDPMDLVLELPDGRSVIELFTPGVYEDSNMKTSRIIATFRGEPAELLKPLKYVVRDQQDGSISHEGTLPPGEPIYIIGWPGFTDKQNCDLIVLRGDHEFGTRDAVSEPLDERVVECEEGVYINLEEGVDYQYTGVAPLCSDKTKEDVMTARDIEYVDEIGCEGIMKAGSSVQLCTQFDESFLELDYVRIMDNPQEGVDYF